MRIVHIDHEGKDKGATLVHAWMEGMSTDKVCAWLTRGVPSSGEMVRVKLRRSAGSGKWVIIVEGRSSSVRSGVTN
jgi:hypothetical protein